MDLETLYRRTMESWTDRILAVGPEQWAHTTPCLKWDVRALVNHVVGEDLWTEPLVHGATIEEVGDRFDGDLLGSDPREAALDAAERASRAVAEAMPKGNKVHLSYGDEDPDEYVRQLVADQLVHGWDLAVAIGADTKFDPELVHEVAAWFTDREDLYRAGGAIASRPGEVSADPQDQLLVAFGRDPRWRPPDGLGDNVP